jgi:uncharacterized protein (TIGR03437 family)
MHLLRVFRPLLVTSLLAGAVSAQPTISAVVNNASGILQGLPNGGIAQGSIFLLVGSGMGPTPTAISTAPFQSANVGGTTVTVTSSSGATANVPLYYTSDAQVSALLPSNTAVGSATITVSYGGSTSASASFLVAANNLGIFTEGQNGQGPAIVTNPDYSLISAAPGTGTLAGGGPGTFNGAANAGDTLILWGTGLGPVSGNETAGAGLGANMPSLPLTVWIGGMQAQVTYQGRSGCCIGEDQIVFVVPAGVPTGCSVPLIVQIGNLVSNATMLPLATSGRVCTPANPAMSVSQVQGLSSATSPPTFAQIILQRQLVANNASGLIYEDTAAAGFAQLTVPAAVQPLVASYFDSIPLGTCTTYNTVTAITIPSASYSGVDAGKITLTNSSGSMSITPKPSGGLPTQYSAVLSQTATYFFGGPYTVSAPGGVGIGNFNAGFTISSTPTWTAANEFQISKGITRASGMTVTWTGGSSAYLVEIGGKAATDNTGAVGAGFTCRVPSTLGTFTVPSTILFALPGTLYAEIDFRPTLTPVPVSASGLTYGAISMNYDTSTFPLIQ